MNSSDTRKANAKAVRRYVELHDIIHRSSAGSQIDATDLRKPESSSPTPDKGLDFAAENEDARRILTPIFAEMARKPTGSPGHTMYRALCQAGLDTNDVGTLMRWEDGSTAASRRSYETFKRACRFVAGRIAAMHGPDRRIQVELPDSAKNQNEPEGGGKVGRRHRKEDAYRDLAALVEKRAASGEAVEAGVHEVAHNNDCSPAKVWRARAFVRDEAESA